MISFVCNTRADRIRLGRMIGTAIASFRIQRGHPVEPDRWRVDFANVRREKGDDEQMVEDLVEGFAAGVDDVLAELKPSPDLRA